MSQRHSLKESHATTFCAPALAGEYTVDQAMDDMVAAAAKKGKTVGAAARLRECILLVCVCLCVCCMCAHACACVCVSMSMRKILRSEAGSCCSWSPLPAVQPAI